MHTFVTMDEIVNKIANSSLTAIDLSDYKPQKNSLAGFDFAPHLWNEFILKEKDFRVFLSEHDWSQYANKNVYLYCSNDAILPSWAFMIVSSKLIGIAETITVGNEQDAIQKAMEKHISELNTEDFREGKLIVKGCSDIPNPEAMMSHFLQKVQPVCSSIMYGEPCSTVPIYKKPKVKAV